ncbi:hypothetical protein CC80DRAFT_554729 [Byssothecium circinans]|uniref:Uncharacterized protein n=1 Tax=Byssothecium circinans TaxID=147558 RepID=A0A6A5TGW4_9PLEO|nr:hypothetical protein CC80DRAFT_554729 [Byssothecium circinans]
MSLIVTCGIYNLPRRTHSNQRSTSTHTRPTTSYTSLTNDDIKTLTSILHGPPIPSSAPDLTNHTQKTASLIASLPPHLRSSSRIRNDPPSTYTSYAHDPSGKLKNHYLCTLHKGLERKLVHSIWHLVRHELSHGIGKFIYPVLMVPGYLTAREEDMARQLEPVLRLFHPDYTPQAATPVGKTIINPGYTAEDGSFVPKWAPQHDGCVACVLARIGADEDVVVALLAGTVAHVGRKHAGERKGVKSVRVRFFMEWVRGVSADRVFGGLRVKRAWELGEKIRAARRDVKGSGVRIPPPPGRGTGDGEGEWEVIETGGEVTPRARSRSPSPSRTRSDAGRRRRSGHAGISPPPPSPSDRPLSRHNPYIYTPRAPDGNSFASSPPLNPYLIPNHRNRTPSVHNVPHSHPTLTVPPTNRPRPRSQVASLAAAIEAETASASAPTHGYDSDSVSSPSRYSQLSWNRVQQEWDGRSVAATTVRGRGGERERERGDSVMGGRRGPASVFAGYDDDDEDEDDGGEDVFEGEDFGVSVSP